MKRTIKYILTAILLLSVTELYAQKSSAAVMDVRVEVVSGSSVTVNSSDQLETGWEVYSGDKNFKVGHFSVSLPDGVEIVSEINDKLNLTNGVAAVDLSTNVHQRKNKDGSVIFEVTGRNDGKTLESEGHYSGKKVATIQYL